MSIHFSSDFQARTHDRDLITEAIRQVDPMGVDTDRVCWYVTADTPQDGVHVYTVMNETGTLVASAFSVRELVERIRREGPR